MRPQGGSAPIDPDLEPGEVLAMVTTMALAWSPASPFYAAAEDPESDHEQRRRFLAEAVRRALGPRPPK